MDDLAVMEAGDRKVPITAYGHAFPENALTPVNDTALISGIRGLGRSPLCPTPKDAAGRAERPPTRPGEARSMLTYRPSGMERTMV